MGPGLSGRAPGLKVIRESPGRAGERCAAPFALYSAAEREPIVEGSKLISDTATVEAIDVGTRQLTLKGSDGRTATFDVDEQVKNLPQVQVGDHVVVDYIEGWAVDIVKPDTAPSVVVEQASEVAKPGEKPAMAGAHRIMLVAVVEEIDENAPSVTLRGPNGHPLEIKVRDPDNLSKVRIGETVQITYTQALAVSVHQP
jgi:hypothetical protein